MTGGADDSKTFVIQTVKLAFEFNKVGLASAPRRWCCWRSCWW